MKLSIADLQDYLADHYHDRTTDESMFMKLVEEIGEVAEVLNKKNGRKKRENEDLQAQLASELADVIHYTVAIAALNHIDLSQAILEKDKTASVRYHHRTNLESFIQENA